MSQKLKVRFGEVKHGSISVEIVGSDRELTIYASYIPYDSLFEYYKHCFRSAILTIAE